MTYVYAIKSLSRKYLYVGLTNNMNRRLRQHHRGENKSTKGYVPFELILKEVFETRAEARRREKHLKSGIGKEFLYSLIK